MGLKTTFSAALHNVISNRPPKTERILSLFLITVISLMSVAMLTVMTEGLESDLSKHYLESNTQKAVNIAEQIERFIETRRIQLEDQSNSSVIKQTVMRPDSNQGLIGDYFDNQSIVGKRYPQTLYDFKGAAIFSTTNNNKEHSALVKNLDAKQPFLVSEEFKDLYNQSQSYAIQISTNRKFWEIALPVRYGKSVEGILLTRIPVEEMIDVLNLRDMFDVKIKASTLNGQALTWGGESTRWTSIQTSPHLNLAYDIDMSSMQDSFNSATARLIISAIVIAIVAIGFAIVMGRWFFVRPIEKLGEFASALSDGADPHLDQTKRITIEIQDLSDRITDMAKKINRREQALIKSNQTLKENQDTLVHAEKMAGLGQVTAGVAHEINNPIGFIMNNLTMLQEYHAFIKQLVEQLITLKDKLPEESQSLLKAELDAIANTLEQEDLDFVINDLDCVTNESISGAERVREITQALKGYAYSGEKSTLTNINECIESTLRMVWNELKYNCTVDKSLGQLPEIECMGGQINQVFMNLFVNASHAMEGTKGLLSIATEADDKHVKIKISDNGSGIKPEHLKLIFDPFFTTKAVGQGTGLGMSICYDIIKKHGGDICVESELGEGTTFYLYLPIDKEGT